jgi:small subunit ribosomal protein S1
VIDTYNIGDELEGTVTKVVTFGAFVEILDGVEGLVHISELSQQHVENPREIIQPGDEVRVKILEIDSERRRLSLSVKRVEDQVLPVRPIEPVSGDLDDMPELGLSEDVFAESAMDASGATVESPGADSVGSSVERSDGGADIGAELPGGGETVEPAEAEATAEAEPAAVAEPAEAEATAEPEPEADGDGEAAASEDAELDAVDAPAGVSTSGPGEPTA